MIMYYNKLLELCDYDPEEIERNRQRLERAFTLLQLTPEDFTRAEERVTYFFDIDLRCVRKMLGMWVKSLVDLSMAKEDGKKVVYTAMPPLFHILNGLAIVSEDLYVSSPDLLLSTCMGGMFGKITNLMELAEGDWLPAGSAFCSPIQVKLGAIKKGIIPMPDLLVSSAHVCDQTPKIDELLNLEYGIPVLYGDGPHDEYEKTWPSVSDKRVKYVTAESKDILDRIKELFGYTVTEEIATRADLLGGKLFVKSNQLFELLKNADPVPIGFNSFGLLVRVCKLGINTTTFSSDPEGLLDLCYTELKDRIDKGIGVQQKGAPRVGVITLYSIPEPVKIFEEAGLAIIADFTGLSMPSVDIFESQYTDFWEKSAETLLHFCALKFPKRLMHICKEWNLDGAILNYQIGCRDISVGTLKSSELIKEELGIPSLVLESDLTDPRHLSVESVRSRVEAFAEILKANKAVKSK
jgi:benzoyl-CoA reductase/2-hydroxyglutaryl-CoA dehydratase subunit BcrC/BadD/HgdB